MRFTDLLAPLEPGARNWNDEGVVRLPGLFSDTYGDALLRRYEREWLAENGPDVPPNAEHPGGWPDATPYMRHPALRALCCDGRLAQPLEGLLGEPAGVHLNLTGWVSTTRNWHQDTYLNPPEVGDHYAAVWIALEDVADDAGPFQYVPGSHLWGELTRARIWAEMGCDGSDPSWPRRSEELLTPLIDAMLPECEVVTYTPRRGDVLVWHGRLLHRGSEPTNPARSRKALIAHFSGVYHRPDMPTAVQHHALGGWYFPLDTNVPVR